MIKNKQIIIWALFDDGYGSMNKLNISEKYKIISIGIKENKDWNNYHKIDLSITNPNLLKEMSDIAKKYGSPDVIIAFPPCQSWSIADNSRRAFRSIYNVNGIPAMYIYNEHVYDIGKLKRNFYKQQASRLIGETTILGAIQIIKFFQPKIWIIENPKTSKIWEYISCMTKLSGNINNTYYSNYDKVNFTKKPTTFLSNIQLYLKNDNSIKSEKNWEFFNNGAGSLISSSIPSMLLTDILVKIESYITEWESDECRFNSCIEKIYGR